MELQGESGDPAMTDKPLFLMTDARHFGVTYQINPWMRPDAWKADTFRRVNSGENFVESIAAADAAGLAMMFTGMRHFRH